MQPSPLDLPPAGPPPSYAIPGAPRPAPPERLLILFFALVLAVLLVAAVGFAYLGPGSVPVIPPNPPTVTITDFSFQWTSPPSTLCSGGSSSWPSVPFSVEAGAQFSLGWRFSCWNNTGAYVIDNITGTTPGFAVVWSNLPVQIVSTDEAYFNVTLSAPSTAYDGSVILYITAHAT